MNCSTERQHQIEKAYTHLFPALKEARKQLSSFIANIAAQIEDRSLVRVRIQKPRIKTLDSVQRKAGKKGFNEEEPLRSIRDLVGIRVVCNNLGDVSRFCQLLEEKLNDEQIINKDDFIRNPQPSGYRAVHFNVYINVSSSFPPNRIPCEIQIRTLLQDAWAELTHDDIYKIDDSLPEDLKSRMGDLAIHLAAADENAQKVRQRISQDFRTDGPIKLDTMTNKGLAYIFEQAFGKSPSDYLIRKANAYCEENRLVTLCKLEKIIQDQEFRELIIQAYLKGTGFGYRPSSENIFQAALRAAARDNEAAVGFIQELARKERNEINCMWRSDVLSEMPETVKEFLEQAETGKLNLDQIAEALGAADNCMCCGTLIVKLDVLSEAIEQHYDIDDGSEIYERLCGLDASWADGYDSDLCGYHGYVMSKDE